MRFLLLAFLATLFRPSAGAELSTKPNDIIGDVKYLLIRDGDKLSVSSGNQTQCPLIPSDNIVGQIISLLNCGPFPLSPNSYLQYSLDYATKNLKLFQVCNRFFTTSKNPKSLQVRCKYDKWIFNKIGCKKTTCPHLTAPYGGHITTDDNTYNTTVYFWCSPGFSINGADELFCEESGLWNMPAPMCLVSYCQTLPSPRHGFVSSQRETATNQTIEFRCESEYTLIGDAVLRCQDDGRWNTTAPVCKKMCTVPNITNQLKSVHTTPELEYLSIGSLVQQGQQVIFSCKPGYTLSASGISTCIEGTWKPPIRCRKTCAALEIANGRYDLWKDLVTIEYSCLPGYELVGQQQISCTSKLTLDGEKPICTKRCTLSKRSQVVSFRQKETYEIIPFGTKIIHGTQVYSICRSGTSRKNNVTECVNGELSPYPCRDPRSRLESGFLELLWKRDWHIICGDTNDVCDAFGYNRTCDADCYSCYHLNVKIYLTRSEIVLFPSRRRPVDSKCIRCS